MPVKYKFPLKIHIYRYLLDPIQRGAIGDSGGRGDGRANRIGASTATEAQRWTPTNTPGSGVPGRVQGRGYEEENEGDE